VRACIGGNRLPSIAKRVRSNHRRTPSQFALARQVTALGDIAFCMALRLL
jgi:hypothetical protein